MDGITLFFSKEREGKGFYTTKNNFLMLKLN
jgi:hypothetical protein